METENEREDRPFQVFKPTMAELQAVRFKTKKTFRQIPENVEQDSQSEIEKTSLEENNEARFRCD